MIKTTILSLVCCLLAVLTLQAQNDQYTYLTDKKFKNAEELFGYTFVPSLMEIPEPGQTEPGDQVKIDAGSFKFGIAKGNLFVKGDGISDVHNINQINATDYGYQLVLMNARDPKQQGHLKVIMLKNFVDALVFKAHNDAKEMVFLLPEIEKSLLESEKSYFTDKSEIGIESEDDIWNKEIKPFFKIIMPKRVYQRIRESDNVKISFVETETIIEKGKKNTDDVVLALNDTPVPFANEPEVELKEIEEVEEEVEVEEEESNDFPSYFKVKKVKPEVVEEKVEEVEKEKSMEAPTNEETDEEDLFAKPEQLEEAQEMEKEIKNKKSKDKKVKVILDYHIIINDFVFNEDGTHEPMETKLKVKDWKLRQDDSALNPNEVYQMELETNKGSMYVYLSGSKKITKIEYGSINYLMRGL